MKITVTITVCCATVHLKWCNDQKLKHTAQTTYYYKHGECHVGNFESLTKQTLQNKWLPNNKRYLSTYQSTHGIRFHWHDVTVMCRFAFNHIYMKKGYRIFTFKIFISTKAE